MNNYNFFTVRLPTNVYQAKITITIFLCDKKEFRTYTELLKNAEKCCQVVSHFMIGFLLLKILSKSSRYINLFSHWLRVTSFTTAAFHFLSALHPIPISENNTTTIMALLSVVKLAGIQESSDNYTNVKIGR